MNIRRKIIEEKEWLKLAQQAEWSVNKLAQLCNVSVRGIELRFHKQMGRTPKKWLAEQRQIQAAILMRAGPLVKEVSSQLAYKQPNHFSREFKKQWGCCPTEIGTNETKDGKLRI
jgi:AraC-like DNA-binding protein